MITLRALLLTDVVDSTKLAQAVGDAEMARLWTAHDRAARDLLPVWHGREIDKTDGMLLLFDSAADAAGYALAYHRALAALGLPFKARAGLHVGPVTLRENSAADVALGAKPIEVEGVAKPIAARVMSAARGGQTLLTGDARIALGVTALRLQSHGQWRLQGVTEPVELFELGQDDAGADGDAPFTPPPGGTKAYRVVRQGDLWVPLRQVKHSLPAERDSFVGRQEPLLQLARKLADGARLVSVLGMGGTGKTRLVTRFAWSSLGEFPGGVWFCDLSQARSVDGIYFAVAQGLDVPLGKADPVVQLAHAIAGRGTCLVILDNFEQVARHAEETLGRWLDRAAQAKFIVTTREVLGIAGEETMALAPLPAGDATTLFLRRAESAKQGYHPSADDQTAIEQLVKVLDGLPLAIELAAARVRVMPPRTLLARMNERFKVLWSKGGRHDRQATLRAAFDWSWELLSEPEKAALAQLSVFEGGFTLESADAVLDLSATGDAPWTVDVVHWLVDKSFVRQVADDRFDLLESVREYAAEHLATESRFAGSGPFAQSSAQIRHGRFFAAQKDNKSIWNPSLETQNLVAACRRAVARGDPITAVAVFERAWDALELRGPFRVAIDLADLIGDIPALTVASRARVDQIAGRAMILSGRAADARRHLEAALAAARSTGDRLCEARALAGVAELNSQEGQMPLGRELYEAALAIGLELDDRKLQCAVLNGLGTLHEHLGQLDIAKARYEAALAAARSAGSRRWEGGTLGNLGQFFANSGSTILAMPLYEKAVAIARSLGDRQWEGNMLCNLGLLHHAKGQTEAARTQLDAALQLARDLGYVQLESVVLCNLGIVHEAIDDRETARRHYEAAIAIAHDRNDRRSMGQFVGYLGLLHARDGRFAQARECLEDGEATLRAVGDRVSLGIVLCSQAEMKQREGDARAALALLENATRLAVESGSEPESEFGLALDHVRALLRQSASTTATGR